MTDPLSQALEAIEEKRRRDERRAERVEVIRAEEGSECGCVVAKSMMLRSDRRQAVEYQNNRRPMSRSDKQIPCGNPAAFEIRGNTRILVCVTHLAFVLDHCLIEALDDMEHHFGRHCTIMLRHECEERPMRQYGDPFKPVATCWRCDHADSEERRALARHNREKMRRAARRKASV